MEDTEPSRPSAARYTLLALAAAVPLAALGLASYRFAAVRLREAGEAANMDRVRLTAELVEAELAARLQAVAGDAADLALAEPAGRRDAAAVRRRLEAMRAGTRGVDRAFVVDAAGVLWADAPPAPESQDKSFAHRPWFAELARASAPVISEAYLRHARPQVPVVALAAPIARDGRRAGILVHQYRVSELAGQLGVRVFGREGRTLIIDHAGRALAPREDAETRALSGALPVRGALAGRSGSVEYDDPASRRRMSAAFAPVRAGTRTWAALARVPAGEAEAALAGLRLQLALATLAAGALAAAAALGLARARERERRLAAEVAEHGRRLEARGRELARSNADLEQFAYLASHDLQAPLRSLKNYWDMFDARCGAALDDEGRRLMGLSQQSVARMQALVGDLLAFSRLGREKEAFQPVALDACLDEALADLAAELARRRAAVERSPLPTVPGRAAQLARLFQNLLSNALKYCEDEPRISVSAALDGGTWTVSVVDNGIGVPEAKREAVFGLFERLHPWERYEGSGIGLAACRKIVEHHGGRIWIDPAVGKGTAVRFTMPAA
ncbi:MAG: hypothetical protein HYZ75_03730 [Elusimicrobia bacterium]|nr:hypothetical protein [Elusimicrobiota bacterium]